MRFSKPVSTFCHSAACFTSSARSLVQSTFKNATADATGSDAAANMVRLYASNSFSTSAKLRGGAPSGCLS